MIRVILKAFLLMTLTFASVLSSVSHAQQPTTALTGEWVGNSNPPDRSELVRLSLTEDSGEIRLPLARFSQKLSLVKLEGSRVRFELSSLKLVMTGTIAGDEIKGEAEVPGTKATFHLVRTVKVAPEVLAKYVGAYRFRNGEYFVIDRFAYIPDILHVIDVKSGEVRAMFPRSETQFTAGPALYVATSVRRTITFRGAVRGTKWDEYAKVRVIAKDKKRFRHPGIDVRGPEKRDDPFWTHMRRFYVYDPAPTLRAAACSLA